MKPRLTSQVLDGLGQLAGLVEAGGPAEITGYDEDQLTRLSARGEPRALEGWRAVEVACSWIRKMQDHLEQP